MKVITIVGRKRTGKTTFTCGLIRSLNMQQQYILDVNNEYTRKLGIRNDYKGPVDHDAFLQKVLSVNSSVIVCEEAASYFSSRGREEALVKLLQTSRHTNNVVIIILHSIADLPAYIYGRSDYLALFKTQDFPTALDRRFKNNRQFMEAFTQVEASENPHEFRFYEII